LSAQAITLGPLLLPLALLLGLASAALTVVLAKALGRRAGVDAETVAWHCLLVAAVGARLVFVFEYRTLYLSAPLSILDIRDGGWNAPAGLAFAWLFAVSRMRKLPELTRPLRWALAAGTVLFISGTAVLALQGPRGQPLPDLQFATLEGQPVALRSFVGRPTVVNLWATWCPPCVREMPVFEQAQTQHPGVNFVFLNQGEDPARVARWLRAQQLDLRHVLVDPQRQASARFQQQGYPTTLFFNARGELVSSRIGELSAATLEKNLAGVIR
jgi:thiol-disulfide isomerase/thioredoxin